MSLPDRRHTPRTQHLLLGGSVLFFAKLISGGALLFLTGMTSRYLSGASFGLWSILTNLPVLAATMDFGLGNTLRNKMTVLSAQSGQDSVARTYFFSCFAVFLIAAVVLSAAVSIFYARIPWHTIFSFSETMTEPSWNQACALSIAALLFYFPFSLGTFGFFAYQESHWTAIFDMLRGLLVCTCLAVAIYTRAAFLTLIVLFFGSILLATAVSWGSFLVRRSWHFFWPAFAQIKKVMRDLAPQSLQFAVLQMSAGVILLTDPVLVGWVSGLNDAGNYALVQKLYSLIMVVESLLLTPFWSAYTQAHANQESDWVRTQLKRSVLATVLLLGAGCATVLLGGPWLIRLWTHKSLQMPALFIAMAAWTVVYGVSHCFSVYLNAVGRLKRQTFLAGAAALLNIPLALWLGKLWGPTGVCWAGVICVLPSTINNPLETYRFLHGIDRRRDRVL